MMVEYPGQKGRYVLFALHRSPIQWCTISICWKRDDTLHRSTAAIVKSGFTRIESRRNGALARGWSSLSLRLCLNFFTAADQLGSGKHPHERN